MSGIASLAAALSSVRKELFEALDRVTDDMGDYAPTLGMRNIKGQMVEILVTEQDLLARITGGPGTDPSQDDALMALPVNALRAMLVHSRKETVRVLYDAGDEGLTAEVEVSEGFRGYLELEKVTVADLFWHLVRHESYHSGQLHSYLWARGDNPYDWD